MSKRSRVIGLTATAMALTVALSGCNSSTAGSADGDGTIKLGVLTDLTGPAASAFKSTEQGIKAYVEAANQAGGIAGHKIQYVVRDTASTPTGALTAAQKLVQNDHVFAVVEVSSNFYGAEPYLLKQGVPVVGGGFDGPEWTDSKNTNLFSVIGTFDLDGVSTTVGDYMKSRGATSCGSIGYGSSKASQRGARNAVESCTAVGLKDGYLNDQVPYGTTDVGAIALAIKKAGVDAVYLPVVPNTAFALAAALKQLDVKLKSVMLTTGYGGDLLASKAAVQAAQGYEFGSAGLPIEANTPATRKFAKALAAVGVNGDPSFAQQHAYMGMTAVAAGLKAAGPKPSHASFMTALRGIKSFDAEGLLAPSKIDFSNFKQFAEGGGPAGCLYPVRLTGDKFVPVGGTPICGKKIK
ncbi:ABC transporter substrate-binding protein [Streptomyces sp. NPDC004237]|uniref:ABC transporter substrate-binding protein n=1 Tax=Streptomyces sp. NPDC004237 TaxID=3154455 RepID=UPI0033B39D94